MKKIVSFVIAALLLSGCSVKWDYTPSRYSYKGPEKSYTISVPTFKDDRPADAENDTIKVGKVILHWVPLVLWSNVTTVNRPDEGGIDMPSMTEVLPKDTALELRNSGMFKDVVLGDKKGADYTLKGTIVQTLTKRSATSYGLSFIGTVFEGIFWSPAGNVKNSMKIRFELTNKKGKVLFSKVYHSNSWKPFFVYKLFSKTGLTIQSSLYQHINYQLMRDIENAIKHEGSM